MGYQVSGPQPWSGGGLPASTYAPPAVGSQSNEQRGAAFPADPMAMMQMIMNMQSGQGSNAQNLPSAWQTPNSQLQTFPNPEGFMPFQWPVYSQQMTAQHMNGFGHVGQQQHQQQLPVQMMMVSQPMAPAHSSCTPVSSAGMVHMSPQTGMQAKAAAPRPVVTRESGESQHHGSEELSSHLKWNEYEISVMKCLTLEEQQVVMKLKSSILSLRNELNSLEM
eukprot:CAMPEP_0117653750 /NCGR_PEP_ID=MMETSP0804-20121206/3366_1 /TAXON_ID=1074897 /ORGANISM="Tetraselmis astigmatica, Strain CCMP880" /LENGTH=220 /DNA_ID=CAMNT_0005459963 /DNA_START=301 /DNA_END=963 /DNA_ORIENTATION=+